MKPVQAVTSYIRCTVDINFPGDTISCDHCPMLETYSRNQCRLTGEYLIDTRTQGLWCPLDIKEFIGGKDARTEELLPDAE